MRSRRFWEPLFSAVGVVAALMAIGWVSGDAISPWFIANGAAIVAGTRYWVLRTGFDFRSFNRQDRHG